MMSLPSLWLDMDRNILLELSGLKSVGNRPHLVIVLCYLFMWPLVSLHNDAILVLLLTWMQLFKFLDTDKQAYTHLHFAFKTESEI
jgi:hypothetical protein